MSAAGNSVYGYANVDIYPLAAREVGLDMGRTFSILVSQDYFRAQRLRMVGMLDERFPQAAELLADVGPESWPSPPSPWRIGRWCGRTTPRSVSTRR